MSLNIRGEKVFLGRSAFGASSEQNERKLPVGVNQDEGPHLSETKTSAFLRPRSTHLRREIGSEGKSAFAKSDLVGSILRSLEAFFGGGFLPLSTNHALVLGGGGCLTRAGRKASGTGSTSCKRGKKAATGGGGGDAVAGTPSFMKRGKVEKFISGSGSTIKREGPLSGGRARRSENPSAKNLTPSIGSPVGPSSKREKNPGELLSMRGST